MNSTRRFRCYDDVPFYILSNSSKINFIIIAVIDYLIAIPAVMLNLAFLYTTYRHARFRKSVANILLINLAFLDLLIGAICIPLHGIQGIMYSMGIPVCTLTIFNDFISFLLSAPVFGALFFITMDTYCGVVFPFFYQHHITPLKVMTSLWSFCIILIIGTVMSLFLPLWHFYTVTFFVLVSLAIVYFIFAYLHIYIKVSEMHRKVSCISAVSARSQQNGTVKTMKTSIIIIVFFVVSFLPSGVYSLLGVAHRDTEFIRTYLYPWVYLVRLSSALANAFIYYWRLSDIRKATLMLLPDYFRPAVDYKAKRESYLRKISPANRSQISFGKSCYPDDVPNSAIERSFCNYSEWGNKDSAQPKRTRVAVHIQHEATTSFDNTITSETNDEFSSNKKICIEETEKTRKKSVSIAEPCQE